MIYVVIIALWAAVLIPMWLRRHDQVSEVRSTARFSDAMRSLSRADDPQRDEPQVRAAPMTHAARRRTVVLLSLSGLVAVALAGAALGSLPRWLPLVTALLLGAYLVAAALTAPQRAVARTAATRTHVSMPARREHEVAAKQSVDDWETWNAWDDEDDESWSPVPQTIPTYVTAPRASAVPRPIDRAHPGEWTGTAMVDAANRMRASIREAADARSQTAEIPVIEAELPPAAKAAGA